MNKLKQVFTHEENKSPSGHFTTESSEQVHSGSHSTNDNSYTGNRSSTSGQSTTEKLENKAEDVAARHSSNTGSSTTQNLENRAEYAADRNSSNVGSTGVATGGNAASVGHSSNHGTHLTEHAHPPAHTHHQPKRDSILSEADAKLATHDHQHLAPVVHETRQLHEIEEVERQREIDRHVHHVQHHVQPVLDTQHNAEVLREKVVPVTEVRESHVATDEDKAQFAALATARDSVVEAPKERIIIDKGERVVENVAHHVHHIVQPEIERDVHEHTRIHTVIPVHQTLHEAPVVHQSVQHEPMSIEAFTAGGGDLSSKLKHDANLLLHRDNQECERVVDGPAESLTQQLGLSSISDNTGSSSARTSTGTTSASGTTGSVGTTGAAGTTRY